MLLVKPSSLKRACKARCAAGQQAAVQHWGFHSGANSEHQMLLQLLLLHDRLMHGAGLCTS
jgi:hypothetical protein